MNRAAGRLLRTNRTVFFTATQTPSFILVTDKNGVGRAMGQTCSVLLSLTAVLIVLLCPAFAVGQGWPMWGHDAQRTARQTTPGTISEPAIGGWISLGGNLDASEFIATDINLDGHLEVVLIRGGSVVARRLDGTLIWATEPFGIERLLAATDIDRDGRLEVFAVSNNQGLFAFDGLNGDAIWKTSRSLDARLGSVFPLDINADGKDELYVAV